MFFYGLLIALFGLGFYQCQRNFGWFSQSWLARQIPHFIMANGIGLMIPLWVWRDVLLILIVLSIGSEYLRARARKRLAAAEL